jgi:hypothetical protein
VARRIVIEVIHHITHVLYVGQCKVEGFDRLIDLGLRLTGWTKAQHELSGPKKLAQRESEQNRVPVPV